MLEVIVARPRFGSERLKGAIKKLPAVFKVVRQRQAVQKYIMYGYEQGRRNSNFSRWLFF
jgi:hypothetical protein